MLGARVVYLEVMRPFAETALFRWVDGLKVYQVSFQMAVE